MEGGAVFKLFTKVLVLSGIIFGGWYFSYSNTCLSLIFAVFFLGMVAWSYIDLKMHERLCLKECYFHTDSIISKMLSSRFLVTVFFLVISIMMTYTALASIISFQVEELAYLVVHVAFLISIYMGFKRLFSHTVQPHYLKVFAREWSIRIAALFLLVWVVYITYNGTVPAYLQPTLSETLSSATNSLFSQCTLIDYALRLNREIEALSWWLMVKQSDLLHEHMLRSSAWILFIVYQSFAVLGVNRLLGQLIYAVDKITDWLKYKQCEGN
jgi:hypothetical protein